MGLGAVAIALPAQAATLPVRADWEQFLAPATPSEAMFFKWVGDRLAPDTSDASGRHYMVSTRPAYPGGLDCYTSPDGHIAEVLLYLAAGPLYLDSQVRKAAQLRTPLTLADVRRWYGAPAEEATSSRTAASILVYHYQGDPTRTLRFDSLPHSPYLHRVIVTRGAP